MKVGEREVVWAARLLPCSPTLSEEANAEVSLSPLSLKLVTSWEEGDVAA